MTFDDAPMIDDPASAQWVEAAGGLVVDNAEGSERVAVVHRPKWDDWSLPKGHRKAGESLIECALREVAEETGLRCEASGDPVEIHYADHRSRLKRVSYWRMTPLEGSFEPTAEVDRMRWLLRANADRLLTYDDDRRVLAALW